LFAMIWFYTNQKLIHGGERTLPVSRLFQRLIWKIWNFIFLDT
jgi:hypothetical protein